MKMTSAEANKLINQLRDEYKLIQEQESNLLTFIAATTENVEEVRPPYNYRETAERKAEIEAKIRKIKHCLNSFNVSTVVDGFDMTIDQVLVFLPQCTETLRKLNDMLSKPARSRVDSPYGRNFIEYEYLNYDLNQVREDYDALKEKKIRLLTVLDVLNNTVELEVDI